MVSMFHVSGEMRKTCVPWAASSKIPRIPAFGREECAKSKISRYHKKERN